MNPQRHELAEAYIRAINNHDAASFIALLAGDAVVDDVGREFRGLDAIKAWSDRDIFDAQVTLDAIDITDQDGESVIIAKVDGTFDRTGLPDPLILAMYIAVEDEKIVRLRCRLAGESKIAKTP